MLKILAIDQGEHLGGAEYFFSEVLTRLPADRYQVCLMTGRNVKYHQLYAGSAVELFPTDLDPLRPFSWTSVRSFRRVRGELRTRIRELQPDLILSNTVRTHLYASPVAKHLDIPLIWMAHDLTFPRTLLRLFVKYPRLIIACSRYVRDWYGVPEKTEVFYPFGIEQELLDQLKDLEKQKVIGMLGKFIPWKGQDVFIEVASRLHQEFPEYRFEIIGSTYSGHQASERFFSYCRELIQEKGMEDVLRIKSYVKSVYDEIGAWETLVHCALEPEPLGRAVAEGMAARCAVVCADLGGPKELVGDRETGFVVAADPDVLFGVLLDLIQDPQGKEQVARLGQQYIADHFLWTLQMKSFERFLNGGR